MRFFLRSIARLLFGVRVVGHLASFGHADRLLLVANHHSRLDAVLLALFVPRVPVIVVPAEETRSRLMRWLLGHVDHEVHDLNNPLSMKPLLRLLRGGRPVVLFPEGRIARNAAVMKVYPVPALIALKSGAAVLPVHVEGAGQWFSRSGSTPVVRRLLPSITIRVFAPTLIDGRAAGSARRRRAFATRRLTAIRQTMALQSQACNPLFECFPDTAPVHGRGAVLMEDQNEDPQTYGQLLRMSLALSRLLKRFTSQGENVGVLLPNLVPAVGVVMGLSATGRVPAIFNYAAGPLGVGSARGAACLRTAIPARQ